MSLELTNTIGESETQQPLDGSHFEGASEEAQVSGSGNNNGEEEEEEEMQDSSPFDDIAVGEDQHPASATTATETPPVNGDASAAEGSSENSQSATPP